MNAFCIQVAFVLVSVKLCIIGLGIGVFLYSGTLLC